MESKMDFSELSASHAVTFLIGFILGMIFMRWWIGEVFRSAYNMLYKAMAADFDACMREHRLNEREAAIWRHEKQIRDDEQRAIEIYPFRSGT